MIATKFIMQTTCVAALALCIGGANAAAPADSGWPAKWPSSVEGNTRLQEDLVKTDYTAEEKRNIMTVLNEFSDEGRAAWLKDSKHAAHVGFPGLDTYYGSHDFDEAKSLPDRKDRFIDIIAKANRVAAAYVISGHQKGSIYGFKGDGKALEILEVFYRTFDKDGHTVDNVIRGEELQLYVALGGKVNFSKEGIAAQIAANPPEPPPGSTPPRARNARPQTPIEWPPAKWPDNMNPKLVKWLAETSWSDDEKRVILNTINQGNDAAPPATPPAPRHVDLTVTPACGLYCPKGRRGFDFIDQLSGFHGYFAPTSVADRVNITDDMIVKGNRAWRWFQGKGHQTGYFYGFPGDGHALEWREMGFGGGPVGANGLGIRAEELQLYVSMGGKLQFPGKPPVP